MFAQLRQSLVVSQLPSSFQPTSKSVIVGVKIDPPWETEGNLTPERQKEQRAAIVRSIDQVLVGLEASKVYTRWEFIPYFAITADAETLEYLSNHPLVISIQEDRPEHSTLQENE